MNEQTACLETIRITGDCIYEPPCHELCPYAKALLMIENVLEATHE